MEEKVILEKVRGGDTAAFALLYDRYWLKVYNFARLYITSSSEVSEVVQDVFVKVWESRDTFDETKTLTVSFSSLPAISFSIIHAGILMS